VRKEKEILPKTGLLDSGFPRLEVSDSHQGCSGAVGGFKLQAGYIERPGHMVRTHRCIYKTTMTILTINFTFQNVMTSEEIEYKS
jgi:hypothetical protein